MLRQHHVHPWKLLAACLIVLPALSLSLLETGCNKKATGNDGGPEPGAWRLELRASPVMHRDATQHHVINDTVVVRLYNSSGAIAGGIVINSQAIQSPNTVTRTVTSQSDTITYPWGCLPALIYWGSGDPDPNTPEVIQSQAVVGNDTVARGEARFLVHDPIQLELTGPDTMRRDGTGHVPHTRLTVRLRNETGALLNDVPVYCTALIGAGMVTPVVNTRADTVLRPWGSDPAIEYSGAGDITEPDRLETIYGYAIVDNDTIRATKNFAVVN
ncbi:MAG TPA: hypothetical protein VGL38_02235 [bacterium]|jgi:hypothetical protein